MNLIWNQPRFCMRLSSEKPKKSSQNSGTAHNSRWDSTQLGRFPQTLPNLTTTVLCRLKLRELSVTSRMCDSTHFSKEREQERGDGICRSFEIDARAADMWPASFLLGPSDNIFLLVLIFLTWSIRRKLRNLWDYVARNFMTRTDSIDKAEISKTVHWAEHLPTIGETKSAEC